MGKGISRTLEGIINKRDGRKHVRWVFVVLPDKKAKQEVLRFFTRPACTLHHQTARLVSQACRRPVVDLSRKFPSRIRRKGKSTGN